MYYLIDVTTLKAGGNNPIAIFEYADAKQVEMVFHQTIASKMADDKVKTSLVQIMGETGAVIKTNYYNGIDPVE